MFSWFSLIPCRWTLASQSVDPHRFLTSNPSNPLSLSLSLSLGDVPPWQVLTYFEDLEEIIGEVQEGKCRSPATSEQPSRPPFTIYPISLDFVPVFLRRKAHSRSHMVL